MPSRDRTGTKYEKLLVASLEHLGYLKDANVGDNYLKPSPRAELAIPGTYIQPDIVVRHHQQLKAIIYSTHWSNTRSSKYKFWRTWEEAAQQKLAVGENLLTINAVFEALPEGSQPSIYVTAEELPKDPMREKAVPIQLHGWDPGIGWAMVEAFDVTILFPVGYSPLEKSSNITEAAHDETTTHLLKAALGREPKHFLNGVWSLLGELRESACADSPQFVPTRSRYRIGLLHLYLLHRLVQRRHPEHAPSLRALITSLDAGAHGTMDMKWLAKAEAFRQFGCDELIALLYNLTGIHVRKGKYPVSFCTITEVNHATLGRLTKVVFNEDLRLCLQDLRTHLASPGFLEVVERAFSRFDEGYGVQAALDDLANPALVQEKEAFVRETFKKALSDPAKLGQLLQKHAKQLSPERKFVSTHTANWVFELLLYMTGLNSAEDIQTSFKEIFEETGAKLRPHAPFGDHAKAIAHMLQGRDLCEHWSEHGTKRTLKPEEFRTRSWAAVAQAIVQGFQNAGGQLQPAAEVIKRYVENKSMRIISSDLNGFEVLVEHYLRDLCRFTFVDEDGDKDDMTQSDLGTRICPSWQTEVVQGIWGARPLETWCEGVALNGQWIIKVQSSQDGNEGHKTKELAGRRRGIYVAFSPLGTTTSRAAWSFESRAFPKMALILDGDWDEKRKRNLLEAGWDWIGGVGQIAELRGLMTGDNS